MRPPVIAPELRQWTMSDGYRLQGRVWKPGDTAASRAVIYVHGIQSHGGWFEWSASLIAQTGLPVILPDRRGSGLNQTARGDAPSAERWLADLDEVAAWTAGALGVSVFDLVGVSWGGKLAVAWALRHPKRVGRVLVIAPGLFPAVDVGLWTRVRIGLALVTDSRRRFAIPLDDPALFTDNPFGRAFIADDPLKLTRATARFFWYSNRLDGRLSRAAAGALPAETTLVLAGRDRIIRNEPTERWIRRLTRGRARSITFPGAAHTLEFSADPDPLRDLVERWTREGAGKRGNREGFATEAC
jgi:alpha-beta hydrolase superfamily lysophospholipase